MNEDFASSFGRVIQIDEGKIKERLSEIVRGSVMMSRLSVGGAEPAILHLTAILRLRPCDVASPGV